MGKGIRIGARLVIGFAAILLLLVGIAIFSIVEVNQIKGALITVNELNSIKQRYAINFRGSVHNWSIAVRDVVLVNTPKDPDETLTYIDGQTKDYTASAGPTDAIFADKGGVDQQETDILSNIKAIEIKTSPLIKQIVDLRKSDQKDRAYGVLMDQARPLFVDWLTEINKFIDLEEAKSKIEAQKASGIANDFQTLMLVVVGLAFMVGCGIAFWCMNSIRPLRSLTTSVLALANGDLSAAVPAFRSKDEVGDIASALHVFKDNAVSARRAAKQTETESREKLQRAQELDSLIRGFEGQVRTLVGTLTSAAIELQSSAQSMSTTAGRTNRQSNTAAAASEKTTSNVQAVAAATEELTSSISEISRRVNQSSSIAQTTKDDSSWTRAIRSAWLASHSYA